MSPNCEVTHGESLFRRNVWCEGSAGSIFPCVFPPGIYKWSCGGPWTWSFFYELLQPLVLHSDFALPLQMGCVLWWLFTSYQDICFLHVHRNSLSPPKKWLWQSIFSDFLWYTFPSVAFSWLKWSKGSLIWFMTSFVSSGNYLISDYSGHRTALSVTYLYSKIKPRVHFFSRYLFSKSSSTTIVLKFSSCVFTSFFLDMEMSLRITPGASLTKFPCVGATFLFYRAIEFLSSFVTLTRSLFFFSVHLLFFLVF